MDDELEALQSLYDTLTVSTPVVATETTTVLSLPCKPRSSAASFVSATVEITVPATYPAALPSLRVVQSSGLSDQGGAVAAQARDALRAAEPGEPVLFQLIDAVFDALDAANQGECLICADGLGTHALADDVDGSAGLLTKCHHTFHAKCLLRWAGIVLAKHASTPASSGGSGGSSGGGGASEVRALEGTVRAACAEIEALQASVDALHAQLEQLLAAATPTDTATSCAAGEDVLLQQRIKERRGRLSACVEAMQRTKGKGDKAALAEEAAALRRDIAQDEGRLAAVEAAMRGKGATVDGADKEAAALREALAAATAKRAQRAQRLEQHRADLAAAQARAAQRAGAAAAARTFPCPFCRAPLRAAGGADVGIADGATGSDAAVFRRLLDAAVAEEEAKAGAASTSAVAAALPAAPQSVFALPADLQALVKKVQDEQRALRQRCRVVGNDKTA